jgi:hypothetical protein
MVYTQAQGPPLREPNQPEEGALGLAELEESKETEIRVAPP